MERKNQMDYLTEDPDEYLIRYRHLLADPRFKYQSLGEYWYYSKRYKKWLHIKDGYKTDGATGPGVVDIHSNCHWWHDVCCDDGCWEDGTKMSNWQASTVLGDILWAEAAYYRRKGQNGLYLKRKLESVFWWVATFCGGGGEARKNGMFKVREK